MARFEKVVVSLSNEDRKLLRDVAAAIKGLAPAEVQPRVDGSTFASERLLRRLVEEFPKMPERAGSVYPPKNTPVGPSGASDAWETPDVPEAPYRIEGYFGDGNGWSKKRSDTGSAESNFDN